MLMKRVLTSSLAVLIAFSGALSVHAASSGTISTTYKYGWSNSGGYVNFHPTYGGLTVTDTQITGYAWSANNGWINFNPTNGGVDNTPAGELSGYAWSERSGWISFNGVTIDENGKFEGEATGANETITFDCTNCDVRTTWRPSEDQDEDDDDQGGKQHSGQSGTSHGLFGGMGGSNGSSGVGGTGTSGVSLWNPATWFPPSTNGGASSSSTTSETESKPFSFTNILLPIVLTVGALLGIGGILYVLWRFVLPR